MIAGFSAFAAFMNRGGPINWCIAALYLLTLWVLADRIFYFWRSRYTRSILEAECLAGPGAAAAKTQPGRMAARFYERRDAPPQILLEILDRQGNEITGEMERGFSLLSFIAAAAPLLGLLGTITGLMNAFSRIEAFQKGAVDMGQLSRGIWEAMITTATGLVTALCASAALRLFEFFSNARRRDMALIVSLLCERLRPDCLSPAAARLEEKGSAS